MYTWIQLEHVSECKYQGCVLDESGTDEAEFRRKGVSWWRVAVAIKFLVNAWSLHLEYARVLHESLLVPFLMYGSETVIWRGRRGGLGLGLYRWTTSEVCWVSEEWIKSQMHG